MPIPNNKIELVAAIISTYEKLKMELQSISTEHAKITSLEGHAKGTYMSINNLLAYLIGWGELVLKWQMKKEKGEDVIFPEEGYKWNELGLLAQKFYQDYADDDFPMLLKKLDKTVLRIIQLIEKTPEKELYETYWYKTYPLGRMIQLNTSSPYKNARLRIRKWKKETTL